MNRSATIFSALLTTLCLFAPISRADREQMQQLVPDVTHTRKTDRTYVFSRAQFIYPLGSDRYLHRWVDRPLFVNPDLSQGKGENDLMTLPDYQQMQQSVMRYGLDGFALFPETAGRAQIYDYSKRSAMKGFQLLPVLLNMDYKTGDTGKADVIKMALENPASFRIGGKLVFSSYRVSSSAKITEWQNEVAALRKQFGDQFLFLPALNFFDFPETAQNAPDLLHKFHHNTITMQDVERCKDYLRKWLRVTDGVMFNDVLRLRRRDDLHHFDAVFYREFVIRIMKSVLAEPEFRQKIFGLSSIIGLENSTRTGFSLSSDGTKTLRRSFEAAMSAQPDFIEIPEWDEQNENTSLRPTIYNGLSSMRIMRYYTAKLRGEKPTPMAGDNVGIPDLILSYRKVLTLGEKLEVELLNVPDTEQSVPYTARLTLKDPGGKVVYTSPVYQFDKSRMQDHTVTIPSETLGEYQVLVPHLEIEGDGRKMSFEDGLQYLELRPTWNWDYKWVKQPLRDLLVPQKVDWQVSGAQADGTRLVSATFNANEPLASVEVLDNNDVVYSQAPANDARHYGWHENAEQVVLNLSWQSFPLFNLQGSIRLKNAMGRWLVLSSINTPTPLLPPSFEGQTLELKGMLSNQSPRYAYLAIKRSDIKNAELEINLPGIYEGKIPVQKIVDETVYGIPGAKGFNMVLSRYPSQSSMPRHLNVNKVHFAEIPVLPDMPSSILKLRAIGKSGHIYRSKPVVLQSLTVAKKKITVFSDTENRPITVEVPADRVPDIDYLFNPNHGSALLSEAGRPFWGILGGYFAQVTGRGGGNYGDDSPFIYRARNYPKYDTQAPPQTAVKTAPEWVKTSDGDYALQFDGKGTFVTLPQGVVPPRAAFTMEMDIKPDSVAGRQVIIANRHYAPGSITVYTINGVLKVDSQMEGYRVFTGIDSGLRLPEGQWSRLAISYDQENLLLSVDGKPGKVMPMKGPGQRVTVTALGGFGNMWFKGQIKNLRIQHGVENN